MANRFLRGTLVLTIAGFVVKAIGSVNWILLSRVLGGEGIGIYQMAFPIYLLALQLSSAGIPVAISILTAEKLARGDYWGAKKVFQLSFTALCITGLIASLVVYFGAPWLISSGLIIEPRAYWSLVALAPAIFFVTIISCFRGYLQGWQMMTPTAVSQIVEQLIRVVVMLAAAYLLLPYGLGIAAGGASLGAGVGAFGALLALLYYYRKLPNESDFQKMNFEESVGGEPTETVVESLMDNERGEVVDRAKTMKVVTDKDPGDNDTKTIFQRLLRLAIPISLASLLLPIGANLDLLIVPRRLLVAGFNPTQATELFGYLTGMAIPLINLATIFTAALATSLVPSISSLLSKSDTQGVYLRTAGSIRLTFLGTVPFAVMLYILAEPVVTLIYNAPRAAQATEILAIAIFFLGLHQVSTGILQGLGRPKIPVINMGIAAAAKVFLNYYLTAIPWLGIAGAAYASVVDFAFAAFLNLFFIYKHTGYFLNIPTLLRNTVSALCMGMIMYYIHIYLQGILGMFMNMMCTAMIGGFVYLIMMFLTKGLTKRDAAKLPILNRFIKP